MKWQSFNVSMLADVSKDPSISEVSNLATLTEQLDMLILPSFLCSSSNTLPIITLSIAACAHHYCTSAQVLLKRPVHEGLGPQKGSGLRFSVRIKRVERIAPEGLENSE